MASPLVRPHVFWVHVAKANQYQNRDNIQTSSIFNLLLLCLFVLSVHHNVLYF